MTLTIDQISFLTKRFGFAPTDEQLAIVSDVVDMSNNKPICVQAGAGASKTTTLEMCGIMYHSHKQGSV